MNETFIHKISSPYSPEQLFDLINDVASYPEFIPWCTQAQVLEQTATSMVAELTGSIAGFTKSLVSENTFQRPNQITMQITKAPIKNFSGTWQLTANPTTQQTDITLTIQYTKPWNPLYKKLKTLIDPACEKIIASFIKRAEQCYGQS